MSVLWLRAALAGSGAEAQFVAPVTLLLWATLLFARLFEALAEAPATTDADALHWARMDRMAKRLLWPDNSTWYEPVRAGDLHTGDVVICNEGDIVAADADVVAGAARVVAEGVAGDGEVVVVDASDHGTICCGTRVRSGRLVLRVTGSVEDHSAKAAVMFRNAHLASSADGRAMRRLLVWSSAVHVVFALAVLLSVYAGRAAGPGTTPPVALVVALLAGLLPTAVGALPAALAAARTDVTLRSADISGSDERLTVRPSSASLAAFCVMHDGAKYLAIIPAILAAGWPDAAAFDVLPLASPGRAALAGVMISALAVVALPLLAIGGARRPTGAVSAALRDHRLLNAVAGFVTPLVGVHLLDVVLQWSGMP
jgi:high-affinity K+ transport system ATPase subunit B